MYSSHGEDRVRQRVRDTFYTSSRSGAGGGCTHDIACMHVDHGEAGKMGHDRAQLGGNDPHLVSNKERETQAAQGVEATPHSFEFHGPWRLSYSAY